MTTVPARGIMVSMYVSFTPCLSHPGSWDQCTPWNAPCILVYRRTHMRDLQLQALDWTARKTGGTHCLPWRLSMKTGRWMHRHMVYTDSAYWDSGAVATRQLANVLVWIKNDWWAYCNAICDIQIDKVTKLNLLQCLHVICGCRAVQTNSAEIPLALLHMYIAIVTI